MADLFRGLITDEGIKQAVSTQTNSGWYISPFKYYLKETAATFSQTRKDFSGYWYRGDFASIETLDSTTGTSGTVSRVQLGITLKGTEATQNKDIKEILITCVNPMGQEFLYAIIQPTDDNPIVFIPNVTKEMDFIIALTNTQGQDIYEVKYVDETKLGAYQLRSEKSIPNGYCPLGSDGIVPDDFLPPSSTLPIGFIAPIFCTKDYAPEGYVPCNGAKYNISDYKVVYEYIRDGKLPSCTATEYQNSLDTYGSCARFVLEGTTFRVPYIKDGTTLQQALTDNELSKLYNAGIPNLAGSFVADSGHYIDGKLFRTGRTQKKGATGSDGAEAEILFDANNSNPIYGNSTTVQPNAVSIRWFVLLAHKEITIVDKEEQLALINPFTLLEPKITSIDLANESWIKSIENNWIDGTQYPSVYDLLIKIYNGTVQRTDISVKLSTQVYTDSDFVINNTDYTFRLPLLTPELFVKNIYSSTGTSTKRVLVDKQEPTDTDPTWYNLYSDGWCEQGGLLKVNGNGNYRVTFPVAYKNTLYTCFKNYNFGGSGATYDREASFYNKTTTSMETWEGENAARPMDWITSGYVSMDIVTARVSNNYNLYYYGGAYSKNQGIIDAGKLQDEIDKLKELFRKSHVVVYSWHEERKWYRIYSDGWCEQGGWLTTTSPANEIVTLYKEMKDTDYSVQITDNGSARVSYGFSKNDTKSFTVYKGSGSYAGPWEAKGYIKE